MNNSTWNSVRNFGSSFYLFSVPINPFWNIEYVPFSLLRMRPWISKEEHLTVFWTSPSKDGRIRVVPVTVKVPLLVATLVPPTVDDSRKIHGFRSGTHYNANTIHHTRDSNTCGVFPRIPKTHNGIPCGNSLIGATAAMLLGDRSRACCRRTRCHWRATVRCSRWTLTKPPQSTVSRHNPPRHG